MKSRRQGKSGRQGRPTTRAVAKTNDACQVPQTSRTDYHSGSSVPRNSDSTYTMSDVADQHSASPAKRYGFRVSLGAQHVKRGAAGSCSTIGC
ncbi:hypothetical protein MTP99_006830 [Tenebrio molitor]|nr:hypothetical protein MTP99_006830 [Tenebrio molitor]